VISEGGGGGGDPDNELTCSLQCYRSAPYRQFDNVADLQIVT